MLKNQNRVTGDIHIVTRPNKDTLIILIGKKYEFLK